MTQMTITASQKYRKKMKDPENIQLLSASREKHRIRMKTYRNQLLANEESAKRYRSISAEKMKAYRLKRKQMNERNIGYTSTKVMEKDIRKVEKALPIPELKGKGCIKAIAKKFDIQLVEEIVPKKSRPRKSFIGVEKLVDDFYNLDTISRQLPGKNDFVIVKNAGGKGEKIQKRLMLMMISEAYQEFTETYSDCNVSLSKFFTLRPKNIDIVSKTPHNMCCCIYCENMQFLFESMFQHFSQDITKLNILLEKLVCSKDNFNCMTSKCNLCGDFENKLNVLLKPDSDDVPVKLQRWQKIDNFTQKVDVPLMKLSNIKKIFVDSLKFFKCHMYLIKTHFEFVDDVKKNQEDDSCAIIMDFSQNYAASSQNEIQSAYFSQRQISVFTAVSYIGQREPISFIIVNDDITHSKEQVYYYERLIINSLKIDCPGLKHVTFISDGCAAQFKNKFTLSNLVHAKDDFNVSIEWHFSPTSHGKSAADGIGGSMKRLVHSQVLTGKKEVYNARDFYNCAKSFAKKTRLFCADIEEYERCKIMLKERWKNVKPIPGTRDFHYFAFNQESNKIIASVSSRMEIVKSFKV